MTDCSSAGGSHGDQNNPALVQKGMVSDLPGERGSGALTRLGLGTMQ